MKLRSLYLMMSVMFLFACGKTETVSAPTNSSVPVPNSPKELGQQRTGDYIVTLFNESGVVRQGPNRFVLEVRNAANNELVPVEGGIHIQTTMEMPGHPPMAGTGTAIPGDVPGRYQIGSDFASSPPIGAESSTTRSRRMPGAWKLVVIFHPNQRVEFTADVE